WDIDLVYSDVAQAPADVEAQLGARRLNLDELLSRSDVVSLHCPLNRHTRHLIGEEQLRRMKPTALLINTCRGPVVDEVALQKALREGWIAAAGLDVLEKEPADSDNPLLNMPNVLVTPHIAGSTAERVRRATEFALANVERVIAGQPPLSLVNVQG
ncbi:MAG: lactate dehydrogenase, partial [Chloroflexi bacterium]|nr:lactate dehydrogenase [Chloroflexota bacterium]